MDCKFKGCYWNKKDGCKNKRSMVHTYEGNTSNIVRCSGYTKRFKRTNVTSK